MTKGNGSERGNVSLAISKVANNDEYYTQLIDVDKELSHYDDQFKDKIVYVNCDDYTRSNFYFYFILNYNRLGIKKLLCSGYSLNHDSQDYIVEVDSVTEGEGIPEALDEKITALRNGGDYKSQQCLESLEIADIVVTNPPFSVFRDYIDTLIYYRKDFLIMGLMNAVTYKNVFPLIKQGKIKLGFNNSCKKWFEIVKNSKPTGTECMKVENGVHYYNMGRRVYWYTTLDVEKDYKDIPLVKLYNFEKYPSYYNYAMINVDITKDIPRNYYGLMGVPLSFMPKHNPNQFDIIGLVNASYDHSMGISHWNEKLTNILDSHGLKFSMGFVYLGDDEGMRIPFTRIVIRRKLDEVNNTE